MKKWQKLLVASLVALPAFAHMPSVDAAYTLNENVRNATPALLSASQIGVLKYENPQLADKANKDAILVMSFGTTYKDTRAKTIDATIEAIKKTHPNVRVMTAFTSHIIIDRIKKNEGISYPTPEQALEQLKNEGYTRVALASLDVIPGMEYAYDIGVFNNYKQYFKKMTCGTSLMYWQGQEEQADDVSDTIKALSGQFKRQGKNDAILLLAHGTPQISNAYYSVVQAKLDEMGYKNVYVYTVEGWPNLETVIPKLKANKIKNVTLVPFMMVAGDHANNDMAGDEDDSHKSILQKEGFNVSVDLRGIGENPAIRALYVERANEAWDALVK